MNTKEIIALHEEQETLLIPLYSKAQDNPIMHDENAQRILDGVQYDFARLRIPFKTQVTLLMRAKQMDAYTAQFIVDHPTALIIHLGCGLDSRCLRVGRAHTLWFDLDLPAAIELRRKFYAETDTYHMIGASVTDPDWIDQIPAEGRPVFVVAEGLFMYLKESDLRLLFLRLGRRFSGSSLVFDAFSKLTASRIGAHPSLQKTGAVVQWGIDDPHEIESWAEAGQPRIQLKEEWFYSQSPDIDQLSWFYRFMFRLTGSFPAAQAAHRLLYYTMQPAG